MFLPFTAAPQVKHLYLLGIFCLVCSVPISVGGQDCVFDTDFSDASEYTLNAKFDCDSNPGIFEYTGGRFTVNDMEGLVCGNSDNELRFGTIDISEYINITITFRYTIRDIADGFECTSVFGNGDDLIRLSYNVDGAARGPLHVFCEDTGGGITSSRKAQFSIPDGNNLNVSIFAGTQTQEEFFYFDSFRVCGTKIDPTNPPDPIPDPPPPVVGLPFEEERSKVECRSSNVDAIPTLENNFYDEFPGGSWIDDEGNPVAEIVGSDPNLDIGDNIFYYVLPQGQRSPVRITVLDDSQLSVPDLGPFCEATSISLITLPSKVNGLEGQWDGLGAQKNSSDEWEIDLRDLTLGNNSGLAFNPRSSSCFIDYEVSLYEKFEDLEITSCPPGIINLVDSIPNLSIFYEEIDFRDFGGNPVSDPTNVNAANFPDALTTFVHEVPAGCKNSGELAILVDTSCPNNGDPLSGTMTIDPANGNICYETCGDITIQITGGTAPYKVDFEAVIPTAVGDINVPFFANDVSGNEFMSMICSRPSITPIDFALNPGVIYDAATNTWNIPTFIAREGTIRAWVIDANDDRVAITDELQLTAVNQVTAFPITQDMIEVCPDDVSSFTGLLDVIDGLTNIVREDFVFTNGAGDEITDLTQVDLLDISGVYTGPEGCPSDVTPIPYTTLSPSNPQCGTPPTCTTPPTPILVEGISNQEWCDDGSFTGFRVQADGVFADFQFDWYDANTNARIQQGNVSFDPGADIEGDFYVTAVDPDDATCRSNPLNFSFNYLTPSVTNVNCNVVENGLTLDFEIRPDERIARVSPNTTFTRLTGDIWRLLDAQENTDYTIFIESTPATDRCEMEYLLSSTAYTCEEVVEPCREAGDNIREFVDLGQTIDLEDYLRNNDIVGVFLDENDNPFPNPFTFSGDVTIYHVIERTDNCMEDRATIELQEKAGNLDGTVCEDDVFCSEINIILGDDRGAGPPYSLKFRMFNAVVTDDIVFQPEDITEDTILTINVCVVGTVTTYDSNTKTIIIREGTDAGNITVEDLKDKNDMLIGAIPPIDIEFSEVPEANSIDEIIDVCFSAASTYPINEELNDRILPPGSDDVIEWWYKQPSDVNTVPSDQVLGDAAVDPGEIIYALVTNRDNCKVEVPVTFNVLRDETVEVTYNTIYCEGDAIIPTVVDNGFDLDFEHSPRDGTSSINRATGELINPVPGTTYVITWYTATQCRDSDQAEVTFLADGDTRCNCPELPTPEIANTDVGPQANLGLEGQGISYCRDDDPTLMVGNNEGDLTAVWFDGRAGRELHRGDVFPNPIREQQYFVQFVDANDCKSVLTPTFTIINPGQRLNVRSISICADEERSIDLNSFITNTETFIVDWTDPLGNPIADPSNYTGAGLETNVVYTNFRADYTDPSGCKDFLRNIQFTITSLDNLEFENFVCKPEDDYYTLKFEAPASFNITTDFGVLSKEDGVFLVDSIPIGTDIFLDIKNNFNQCGDTRQVPAPTCDCDRLPPARTAEFIDTICFGGEFEVYNPADAYFINWYNQPSGGIAVSNDVFYSPEVAGNYYFEIIDKETNCVSEVRKEVVVLPDFTQPDESLFNTVNITTCEEQDHIFILSDVPPEFTVVWRDVLADTVAHEGDSFRPDENIYTPGVGPSMDYEFSAVYKNEFGCESPTGQRLFYRIYERPRLSPVDTICSEDLKSVTFQFDTAGEVQEPTGAIQNANGVYELVELPIGENIDILISRGRTGVNCELSRVLFFDPAETCPCPDIPQPDPLGSSAETICANDTDFEFRLNRISIADVVANWYDNPDGLGEPLLSNSLDFSPPDSGVYYVLLVDTITTCTSLPTQLNLFYDDVPNAGEGMTDLVCGSDSISLSQYLIAPFDEGGIWEDQDGNVIEEKISALNYATDVPLSFFYIVSTTNVVQCDDAAEVILTLQAPFDAGTGMDLGAICDQAEEQIDFEAIIGSHDDGFWVDNDGTGIDLNVTPVLNTSDLGPGEYVFSFFVDADLICDSESSDVRVVILPLPEVGIDTRDTICAGEEFGYNFATALDGVSDPLGMWEDIDNRLTTDINDNPGQVDLNGLRPGDYIFRFGHTSGGCSASSELQLHVLDNNFAGVDTLVQICNDGSLALNFERVLPGANGYELSIDGGESIDFTQPENVDVSSLAPGSYRIRNTANSIATCNPDEAIVDLVIEASKIAPPLDDNYNVCFGDTVDLSGLAAAGGEFEEISGVGALSNDTLFTERISPDIPFAITYVIPPDSVCAPQPEAFTVTAMMSPNAGDDVTQIICQGDSIDLSTLLPANADLGGAFGDIESTGQLTGSVLRTETLSESIISFSYEVGDGIVCPIDVAIINIDIREVPMLSDSIDFPICETDATSYDLTVHVGSDLSGEFLNPNNLSVDLTNPSAVDLSGLDFGTTHTLEYTLTNGNCADTLVLTFDIADQLYAGQDGVFIGHCAGESEIISLNDQLIDEDQGVWFDANGIEITDPENFDLGLLPVGSNNLKHLVRETRGGMCVDDSVSISILVEPAPDAGENQTVVQCQNVTYDLQNLFGATVDQTGNFEDRDGHGNLVGSIVDIGSLPEGDYDYYYVLQTNASCPEDVAVFTISVVSNITAGDPGDDQICQGDVFDLLSLLANADPGGRFENADTQTPYTETDLETSSLSGIQNIWYIVESASCESDTSAHILDIRITPQLGDDIDFILCQSGAASVDFLSELGARDQTGTWLDPNNLGIAFNNPAQVDLSTFTPLEPNTVSYTVGNGDCSDTIDVTFTIDKSLFAGGAGITDSHCVGRPRTINLYDYFTNEDQGDWSINGEPVDDPTAFDLSALAAGPYTFLHAVTNTNLGVCPDPQPQTVELIVHAAAFAGIDIEQTLCQNIDFDLISILDAAADNGGVFIDSDENVIGSEITTTGVMEGVYEYEYIVQGDINCDADTAMISITVVSEIDAGEQNGDEVCQGTDFDLTTLIMNGDPGGRFEEVSSGRVFADPILSTDALIGDIDIRYIVDSPTPSCTADTAEYVLTIHPTYDDIEEYKIAEGDSVLINDIWYKEEQTLVFNETTAENCDSTFTAIITVTDFNVEPINVSCAGEGDGGFNITVNAGTLSFSYQITQITGEGGNNISGLITRYGETPTPQFSAGDYSIFITDGNMEVVFDDTLSIQIANQIFPVVNSSPATCFGFEDGSLSIDSILIDGELQSLGAYTYIWSTGDITSSTGKLGGGFHTVQITDTMSMCPYEFEYFVEQPEALMVDTMISDFQCGGTLGSIELDILTNVGDLPEFSLNGGPVQGVGFFSDLEAGFYEVTIAYGVCTQVFDSLEVKQASENTIEIEPNDLELIVGQEQQVNVLPSFDVIDAEWSSYEGLDTTDFLNPIVTAIDSMEYIVTLTDGFGCTFMDTLIVNVTEWQDPIPDLFVPNIFNPSASGNNNTFRPFTENSYPGTYTLQIFNRWGNVIHMQVHDVEDETTGWDGTHNGMRVREGVYTYMIEFNYDNGTNFKRHGDLTVVY